MSDGNHWYDQEGQSQYTIIGANGRERNTTLRDAKKHNYVPSVTSVMNIIAKPSLDYWKLTQALNEASGFQRDWPSCCKRRHKNTRPDRKRLYRECF